MEVTDEELIAYLDDEVSSEDKLRLNQLIADSPDLQLRLAAFRELDNQLTVAHQSIEQLPYPPQVMELLSTTKASELVPDNNTAARDNSTLSRIRNFFSQPLSGSAWTSFAATACALVLGILLGSQLLFSSGTSSQSLVDVAGLITSDNPLHSILEYGPANVTGQFDLEQTATATPILTFRAVDARYCREFTVSTAQQGTRGIACREGDEWRLELMVRDDSLTFADDQYTTASSTAASALDDIFNALASDVPVDAGTEARLIENGWIE